MENPEQKPTEKYEGPSVAAVAVVESKTYGIGGSIVGGVIGALASELLFKPDGKRINKMTNVLKEWDVPFKGKWLMIAASAVIASHVGHTVGQLIGAAIGVKHANRGPAQFARTQDRIATLEHEVVSLKATQKSFAAELAPHASHAESVASEAPAELTR